MSQTLVVLCSIAAVLVFWGVGVHNRLIRLRSAIATAHAQLDAHLVRRYALIPRWVELAQAYFGDAPALLESSSAASQQASAAADALRSAPSSATALRALALADSVLKDAMQNAQDRLNTDALHAAYLAVDQSLRDCSAELDATSSALGFAKESYNQAVLAYSAAIAQFPAVVLAKITGRKHAAVWLG